jgi:hypothetical protein
MGPPWIGFQQNHGPGAAPAMTTGVPPDRRRVRARPGGDTASRDHSAGCLSRRWKLEHRWAASLCVLVAKAMAIDMAQRKMDMLSIF